MRDVSAHWNAIDTSLRARNIQPVAALEAAKAVRQHIKADETAAKEFETALQRAQSEAKAAKIEAKTRRRA